MSEKKEPRTIQVKIGQQSAREMTPDQAAEYLKCMAAAGASGAKGGSERVAFTFGSRNNNNNTKNNDAKASFWKMSAEAKEITASSMNAAVSRASASVLRGQAVSASAATSASSVPCTEKEMKALMSMFVEIMGLQMNTEKLNSVSAKQQQQQQQQAHSRSGGRSKTLFKFPRDIPPPPGGWPADLSWPSSSDLPDMETTTTTLTGGTDGDEVDVPEDDSLPDLEDIPANERGRNLESGTADSSILSSKADTKGGTTESERLTTYSQSPAGYVAGIAVPEWEALERVAMEDALEQEERARKAAQAVSAVTDKKGKRNSPRINSNSGIPIRMADSTESADQRRRSEQERLRQQEKTIAQWRQKVTSACQSNDTETLQTLLQQSLAPLAPSAGKSDDSQDVVMDANVQQCLMDLAAQCLPKNRQAMEKGREGRVMLLKYVLQSPAPQVVLTPQRNGRSVLHTCSFYGDAESVKIILEYASAFDNLAKTCEESGFTPLHYAALSGSASTVQLLVKKEGIAWNEKITNDTHTWDPSSGKGLSVTQLLRNVLKPTSAKTKGMETHGMALAEIQKDMMGSKGSSGRFLSWLEQMAMHLENDSCQSLTTEQLKALDDVLVEEEITTKSEVDDVSVNKSEKSDSGSTLPANANKKKKKKKKGKQNEIPEVSEKVSIEQLKPPPTESTATAALASQDPLVELLVGMGFKKGPVVKGIQACGGPDRATADLVIAWILERNELEESEATDVPMDDTKVVPISEAPQARTSATIEISADTKIQVQAEDETKHDEKRLRAEQLAAKREERRQRNREWNKKQEAQRGPPPPTPATFPKQQPLPAQTAPMQSAAVQTAVVQSAPAQAVPASLSGRTVEFSVDASTVVSSVGDFAKDDDLTVSTIGSRTTTTQTQATPVPPPISSSPSPAYNSSHSQQPTPPGFSAMSGLGSANISSGNDARKSAEPWQPTTNFSSYQTTTAPAAPVPLPPPGLTHHLYSGLPPGIPETHPVVDERIHRPYGGTNPGNSAPALHGETAGFGGHAPVLPGNSPSGLGSHVQVFGGKSAPGMGGHAPILRGNSSPGIGGHAPGLRGNTPGGLAGAGASLGGYSQPPMAPPHEPFGGQGMLHRNAGSYDAYAQPMRHATYPTNDLNAGGYHHNGDGLFGQPPSGSSGFLGSAGDHGGRSGGLPPLSSSSSGFGFPPTRMESSVIESISTGTTELGGSSLWGAANVLSGSSTSNHEHEVASSLLSHLMGDSEKDHQTRPDSLFGPGSTDEDTRRNSHSIW